MNTVVRTLLSVFCLLQASVVFAGTVTTDMERDDPRLAKKVRLTFAHAYVGELLEALSTESGIDISAPRRDGVAGEELIARIKDMSVADCMRSLYSLFGYKDAEWSWIRTKSNEGKYVYSLFRTQWAAELPQRVRADIQTSFEKQAADLLGAVAASDEKGTPAEATDPENTAMLKSSPRLVQGLRLFAELFPKEKRRKILRGEEKPVISMASLSPSQQTFIRSLDGRDPGEPQKIEFDTSLSIGESSPSLFIKVDGAGYSYLGGAPLKRSWNALLGTDWFLKEDTETALESESSYTTAQETERLKDVTPDAKKSLHPLIRLARLYDVSLFAREYEYKAPLLQPNKKLLTVLHEMDEGAYHIVSKWRGSTLLLMPRAVVREDINTDPMWDVAKEARIVKEKNQYGLPLLADLAGFSTKLSQTGYAKLFYSEFGRRNHASTRWHSLLRWLGASPTRMARAASESGVRVTDDLALILREMPMLKGTPAIEKLDAGEVVVLKVSDIHYIREKTPNAAKPTEKVTRLLEASLRDRKGVPLNGFGFGMTSPVLQPVEAEGRP